LTTEGIKGWLCHMAEDSLSLRKAAEKTDLSHGTIADILRGLDLPQKPTGEQVVSRDGRAILLLPSSHAGRGTTCPRSVRSYPQNVNRSIRRGCDPI